jgi:hypothetical protein
MSPAGNEHQQLSMMRFDRAWRHVEAVATAARPIGTKQMRWRAVNDGRTSQRWDLIFDGWVTELFNREHDEMVWTKFLR